jgi:hypothetical protein
VSNEDNSQADSDHTKSGGFVPGLILCLAIELESIAFKSNLIQLLELRDNGLRLALTVFLVGAFGFVIFAFVVKLHRFHSRLVAIGVIAGLILSALLHLDHLDLSHKLDRSYEIWAAWCAVVVDSFFALAATIGIVLLFKSQLGVWKSFKVWITGD